MDRQHGSTRRTIIEALKRQDGLTANELAAMLAITSMAVRKHLTQLEAEELIVSTVERRPVGRPVNHFHLTEAAARLFPNTSDQLTVELLTDLRILSGEDTVDRLFERRTDRLAEELSAAMVGQSLEDRLETLKDAPGQERLPRRVGADAGGRLSPQGVPLRGEQRRALLHAALRLRTRPLSAAPAGRLRHPRAPHDGGRASLLLPHPLRGTGRRCFIDHSCCDCRSDSSAVFAFASCVDSARSLARFPSFPASISVASTSMMTRPPSSAVMSATS